MNFRYFDATPDGEDNEMNCVTRAISVASGIPYFGVRKLLEMTSKEYDCEELCVCCYHRLLEGILGYDVSYCRDGETVGDVARRYRNNVLLIRIDGHLTCSLYGTIIDIWDCSVKKVDCFWICR